MLFLTVIVLALLYTLVVLVDEDIVKLLLATAWAGMGLMAVVACFQALLSFL